MNNALLVELLTEELPPKALKKLGEVFADVLKQELGNCDLLGPTSIATAFASPRRLAAHITDVRSTAPTKRVRKKLMPATVAFEANGKRSEALKKRLAREGYVPFVEGPSVSLIREKEGATEYVYLDYEEGGESLAFNLDFAIKTTIAKLPIPKVMSYQLDDSAKPVQFVRPARGLVALHGDKVVDVSVLGLKAGRVTRGHRFQGVKDVKVKTANAYGEALAVRGKVIASFDERRSEIERQLASHAQKLQLHFSSEPPGLSPQEEFNGLPELDALVNEVTALVEYPAVYVGEFDGEFLAMPRECLILTMRQNQKYFPLFDRSGELTNRFLFVSNMHPADARQIVHGNERVLRARLSDAKFFFDQDRKVRLESRVPKLAHVVYHSMLGSQLDRVERIRVLAETIARELGADATLANRAALLSKADLLTDMVGEFPELQGVMGRYYALHDEEPKEVAQAIEAHYRPRFSGDALPEEPVAIAVALADKLDTLVGMRGKGIVPTGDRDPFGLRRHAVGILRILIENRLPLDLHDLLEGAKKIYDRLDQMQPGQGELNIRYLLNDTVALVYEFMLERLRSYLRDREFAADEIEAVVSQAPTRMDLLLPRLEAVREFRKLPEAESLAIANKRIRNILKQAPPTDGAVGIGGKWEKPAEAALFNAVNQLAPKIKAHFDRQQYNNALIELAQLRVPVDKFFEDVMVMADDPTLRNSRLDLLRNLFGLMNQVADISKLAVEK